MPNNLTSFRAQRGQPLEDTQQDTARAFAELSPLAYAKEIIGVTVGTLETAIPHGLGYAPRHVVVSRGETGAVLESRSPDTQFVYLVTSGASRVVNLLVV